MAEFYIRPQGLQDYAGKLSAVGKKLSVEQQMVLRQKAALVYGSIRNAEIAVRLGNVEKKLAGCSESARSMSRAATDIHGAYIRAENFMILMAIVGSGPALPPEIFEDPAHTCLSISDFISDAWDVIHKYFLGVPHTILKGVNSFKDLLNIMVANMNLKLPKGFGYAGEFLSGIEVINDIINQDGFEAAKDTTLWAVKTLIKAGMEGAAPGAVSAAVFEARYLVGWAINWGKELYQEIVTYPGDSMSYRDSAVIVGSTLADSFGLTTYEIAKAPAEIVNSFLFGESLSKRYADVGLELSWDGVKDGASQIYDYAVDSIKQQYADVGLEFSMKGVAQGVGQIAEYAYDAGKEWVASWWPF